ncbi:MAG: hypothetical protein KF838_08015 [Phycisphaeraceae bacterium]|nr:MAG: hypothetical protein KF838_08015 [Phycisphaeraceae bacterium]
MKQLTNPLLTLLALAPIALSTHAQTDPAPPTPADQAATAPSPELNEKKWTLSFVTYLWVPAMEGDLTVRGREADVNVSVGDSFENLVDNFKFAITGHIEARKDRFSIFGDIMYLATEDDVDRPIIGDGDIDVSQGFFEAGVAYAVVDNPVNNNNARRFRVEPLAGVRLYYLDMEVNFDALSRNPGRDEVWVDGFIGVRTTIDLAERVTGFARFDIGAGGSDLAWNVILGLDAHLGKHKRLSLVGGYRWFDVDYDDGSGNQKFEFDVLMHGPFLGLGFTF